MSMRRILLPEPPPPFAAAAAVPEIFGKGQTSAVVRRAVIIGNGLPGAENQCMGLLRALGMGPAATLHRVARPQGGVNEYLKWLPVPVHRRLDKYLLRLLWGLARVLSLVLKWLGIKRIPGRKGSAGDLASWSPAWSREGIQSDPLLQAQPLISFVPPPLEADASEIAVSAQNGFQGDQGPLLVVACGRDTVSVAATVKRLAGPAAFVVQISQPREKSEQFDLVLTPQHDFYALTARGQAEVSKWLRPFVMPPLPGRNVALVLAWKSLVSLLPINESKEMMSSSASTWHDALHSLPRPLVIVNIGGPTRNCQYGLKFIQNLAATLRHLVEKNGGSMRISFTRRTPLEMRDLLTEQLEGQPRIYIWHGDGPNPHFGHLAWGDAFVVTADSVNMVSEACSTGKPVYIAGKELCRWKLAEFHRTLHRRGSTRPLSPNQDMSEFWSYPPLRDEVEVATRVRTELAKRGFVFPS